MIYLLEQILLCVLLAALAGWFVGWSWRGFREQDRVEDLRRTLRATEEVKDRDLAEGQRREDALKARVEVLERRSERLADELSAARRGESPTASEPSAGSRRERDGAPRSAPAPEAADEADARRRTATAPASAGSGEAREARSGEQAELREVAEKLARLEATLEELRGGATEVSSTDAPERPRQRRGPDSGSGRDLGARDPQDARLDRRRLELEMLEERLARREADLRAREARLQESAHERRPETGAASGDDGGWDTMIDERLRECDRQLEELRDDHDEALARLAAIESRRRRAPLREREDEPGDAGRSGAMLNEAREIERRLRKCARRVQQVEGQLEAARAALRREIERGRGR